MTDNQSWTLVPDKPLAFRFKNNPPPPGYYPYKHIQHLCSLAAARDEVRAQNLVHSAEDRRALADELRRLARSLGRAPESDIYDDLWNVFVWMHGANEYEISIGSDG